MNVYINTFILPLLHLEQDESDDKVIAMQDDASSRTVGHDSDVSLRHGAQEADAQREYMIISTDFISFHTAGVPAERIRLQYCHTAQ